MQVNSSDFSAICLIKRTPKREFITHTPIIYKIHTRYTYETDFLNTTPDKLMNNTITQSHMTLILTQLALERFHGSVHKQAYTRTTYSTHTQHTRFQHTHAF